MVINHVSVRPGMILQVVVIGSVDFIETIEVTSSSSAPSSSSSSSSSSCIRSNYDMVQRPMPNYAWVYIYMPISNMPRHDNFVNSNSLVNCVSSWSLMLSQQPNTWHVGHLEGRPLLTYHLTEWGGVIIHPYHCNCSPHQNLKKSNVHSFWFPLRFQSCVCVCAFFSARIMWKENMVALLMAKTSIAPVDMN